MTIRIGEWTLDAASNRLVGDGGSVALEPLAASVLEYLAAHPGRVVSGDELVEALWPRKIVGDSPVYRIIADLRRALGDDARNARYIETIRKRGYKLVAPVEAAGPGVAELPVSAAPTEAAGDAADSRRSRRPVIAAVAAVAVIALLLAYFLPLRPGMPVDPPAGAIESVAVLPFEGLSPDTESEHLGDGIAEVLIHRLSQVPGLKVIARNSSFAYRDPAANVRDIAADLGVTTVLAGSVQRSGADLRVAAQLVDAGTGAQHWSLLFDRRIDDIFDVQDEIAAAVVAELEQSSRAGAANPPEAAQPRLDAYELYLLGRHRAAGLQTEAAIELFQRAIDRDPDFALAWSGLAEAIVEGLYVDSQSIETDSGLERARRATERALELAPGRAESHATLMRLAAYEGDHDTVDQAYRDAIAINPSHVPAHLVYIEDLVQRAWSGIDRAILEEATLLAERTAELDPLNFRLRQNQARIARLLGENGRAEAHLQEAYRLARSRGQASRALASLAFLKLDTEVFDEAVAYFQLARQYGAEDAGVYSTYLAHAYLLMQDYESARHWLEQVNKPYGPEARFVWLDLLLLSGDDETLISEINALLDSGGERADLPRAEILSLAMFFIGAAGDCGRLLDVAREIDLEAERVRQPASDLYLSWCYGEAGDEARAAEHLAHSKDYVRRVRESGIVSRIDRYVMAWVHALEGDREAALAALEDLYRRGFRAPDFIARDRLFSDYRTDERFARLLEDMRRSVEAMRKRVFRARQSGDWFSLVDVEPWPVDERTGNRESVP